MSIELVLPLVVAVGGLIGLGLGLYVTRPKRRTLTSDALTSWVEQQEALEGIYHGMKGCNDPDHGHPIDSEATL